MPATPTEIQTISTVRLSRQKRAAHVKEYIEAVLVAVVIAVILRMFVIEAYRVSSGSMEDTLQEGDFLFVNKFAYHFAEPKLGDIIVFEFPLNPSKDFIKRIAAVGGQIVEVRDKKLYVDGNLVEDVTGVKHIDSETIPEIFSSRDNFGPLTVPSGQYFVLGDNRDDSQDSRFWGFLEKRFIKGRVLFIYWSWAPDPEAPNLEPPYIFDAFNLLFYNLTHFPSRVHWERLFQTF